jgi:hypothetical protein
MCDLTNFETEKLRIKKKIRESEEGRESEPKIEKIQHEKQPIEITQ